MTWKAPRARIARIAALAGAPDGAEIQPVGGDHQHVERERPDLAAARLHEAALHEAAAQALHRRQLGVDDPVEALAQPAVAPDDVVEVPVEEAVVPDRLEHEVQVEPEVLDRPGAGDRLGRVDRDALLEPLEDLLDDLVLVAEVVVEVPRADVQLVGDHAGGDVRLAPRVEERQAHGEDALPGALGAHRVSVEGGPAGGRLRHDRRGYHAAARSFAASQRRRSTSVSRRSAAASGSRQGAGKGLARCFGRSPIRRSGSLRMSMPQGGSRGGRAPARARSAGAAGRAGCAGRRARKGGRGSSRRRCS